MMPIFHTNQISASGTTCNITHCLSDNISSMPSFTIQSLLDQMMGQNFENDEFLGDIITSKYFTPLKLLETKLPNKFSVLNIA